MAKFRVSFEVDDVECFDMIARNRELMTELGLRLAEVALCPGNLDWKNTVGLSIYGISDVQTQRLAEEAA